MDNVSREYKRLHGVMEKIILLLFVSCCVLGLDNPCSTKTPPPPTPLNARLNTTTTTLVNETRIICDEGFELFGDAIVKCSEGGWVLAGYCATNVATHRPTNQSSTASIVSSNSSQTTTGKQLSTYANDHSPTTCSQTVKELNPFWKLDLLQTHQISGVRLTTGDMNQTLDLEIRVGDNPHGLKNPLCVWQPSLELVGSKLLTCARPVRGRHLSIQIIGSGDYLRLCDVQVYAGDGIPHQRCTAEKTPTEDTTSFNGSCYEFATKSGQPFTTARTLCQGKKGDLLTEQHLKLGSPSYNLVVGNLERLRPTLKRNLVWIGVERDPGYTSRTWRWIDTGLAVKKPNWGKDQPNNYNGEQNCAVLDGGREWSWNDVGCGLDLFHWICVFPPNRCGSPDVNQGTRVTGEYSIGSEIKYSCGVGEFVESGDEVRTCLSGVWNGTAPRCKFIDCGDEPLKKSPQNMTITKNTTYYGSVVTYTCNDGYTIAEGDGVRTCQRDGRWSGEEPKCLKSTCQEPGQIVNGTFKSTGRTAASTVTYTCNDSHLLSGSEVITCKLGGEYDNPPPTCKYVVCGDLPILGNGSFTLMGGSTTHVLGSVAHAKCNVNYELVDKDRIVCSERGRWEVLGGGGYASDVKCELITCQEPEVPGGSFVTGYDFSVGSEIQYHCEDGHVMVGGTEIRRCGLSGRWSGVAPECRFIDCSRPQPIPHGQITYTSGKTHLHSTVRYTCAQNYKLVGDSLRTCTATGHWSNPGQKCEEVRCSFPNLPTSSLATVAKNDRFNTQALIKPETSQQNSTFRIGTVLKVRCERGHVLQGDKTQTCEVGGRWAYGQEPVCKFVDCGQPSDVANSVKTLTSNTTVFGSAVIYECGGGYELIGGGGRRLCGEDGGWGGVAPVCREITCPDQVTNATATYTSRGVGGVATYKCGKGMNLVGETTLTCGESGRWSGSVPICHLTTCPPPPQTPNARQFLVNSSTTYTSLVEYHCIPGHTVSPGQRSVLACNEFGIWDGPAPNCLSQVDFDAVMRDSSSGNSAIGVIVGLGIGFLIVLVVLVVLLWRVRKRIVGKGGGGGEAGEATTKAEPMVVFPTTQNQNYYDNPTVDPIYENLDDYGVTSDVNSDMVTINGVAVA